MSCRHVLAACEDAGFDQSADWSIPAAETHLVWVEIFTTDMSLKEWTIVADSGAD